MKSLDIAWAALERIKPEENADWTVNDCINDVDKAVVAVDLIINSKEFPPFVIDRNGIAAVKEGKEKKTLRTDVTTAKKMLSIRKEFQKYKVNESNPEYVDFWRDSLTINNAYFWKFFVDLYELDPELMDGVNRLRKEDAVKKAEANKKRSEAAKARAAAAKKEQEAEKEAEE